MILPILAEIGGSIHVGLAALGAAIGVGLIGMGAASAVGRNPGAATPILVQAILAIALAEAEQRHAEILAKANAQAQKMIDEARESSAHIAERKQQEAVVAAEQIMAKAREASAIEHERTMTELKRELGRLVVNTTAKVTGKVLTPEDQRRLQDEAARQIAS